MKKNSQKMIQIALLLFFVSVLTISCKKDDTSTTTTPTVNVTIGQSYQGGKVAYILKPGDIGYSATVQHGIIAAPSDQSTGISWINSSSSSQTNATENTIGSGNANTNKIVTVYGNGNYAAKLCYDLVLGGYSDWYLPSLEELNILFENKTIIGGFTGGWYWSSCENISSSNSAWCIYFDAGHGFSEFKDSSYRVRAIRSF